MDPSSEAPAPAECAPAPVECTPAPVKHVDVVALPQEEAAVVREAVAPVEAPSSVVEEAMAAVPSSEVLPLRVESSYGSEVRRLEPQTTAHHPDDDDDRDRGREEEEEEGTDPAFHGDTEEEAEAALVRDFASHPMMDRVQKALVETLARELDRTALSETEKTQAVAAEKKRRETLGVELYGVQQQLAKLQLTLEALHNDGGELQEKRASEEVGAQRHRAEYAATHKALGERLAHVQKTQAELDAVNETLRQVEKYNEEMQKEIAVTKRATYKTEEDVTQLETAKRDQDLYIDGLEARAKSLSEQIAVHEAQLMRQKEESDEAAGTLAETGREMDLIAFEKKQLVQQWKASLVQLARRDEALTAAQRTLDAARTEIRDLQAEIDGTNREVANAEMENEACVAIQSKHEAEEKSAAQSLDKLRAENDALAAQASVLQRSMAHTEAEEAKVLAEGKSGADSLEQLSANIQIVTVERQKLEQRILAAKSAQTTVSKAIKTLRKKTAAVKEVAHAREVEEANLENEAARIRLDAMNTEAHNRQLAETLQGMVDKLTKQDEMVAKYQTEIRARNDDVEKKMSRVDRLNRKYEKMQAGLEEGEHLGPLEATIRNLTKERDSFAVENARLQAAWLADQTTLVQRTQDTEALHEKTNELEAKARILREKRLRLLKEAAGRDTQIHALEASNSAMRGDVARLNDLLGRHSTMHDELSNEIKVLEMEFQSELGELEDRSLAMEQKVAQVKEQKARLLDEVVEVERQVLLWEKKIQLERETQAALDPSVGESEIKAMETEIHRMKIRLDAITREQETMIQDMERAISKREAIGLRFQSKSAVTAAEKKRAARGHGAAVTKAALRKQVGQLRVAIQSTASEASELSQQIQTRQRDLQKATSRLADETARYGRLEHVSAELQAHINTLLYEKQRRSEMQTARDKTASRYLDLERGVLKALRDADAPDADRQLDSAVQQNHKIREVITGLMAQFEYLAEPLDRILRLADDAHTPPIPGAADLSIPEG